MLILKDPHAASDVLQDTFCHYHDRMIDISPEGLKAYLVATARHLALNYVRDEQYEVQTEDIATEAVKVEIPSQSAEETYLTSEQRKSDIQLGAEIFEALRKKNESWYEIMYLFCTEDLSYDEIAEKLNMTVSAISHQLKILKQAKLAKYRKSGKNVIYSLADAHVRTMLGQGMDHITE